MVQLSDAEKNTGRLLLPIHESSSCIFIFGTSAQAAHHWEALQSLSRTIPFPDICTALSSWWFMT